MLTSEQRVQLRGTIKRLLAASDPTVPSSEAIKPWHRAVYSDIGTTLLFLDGWLSEGNDENHLYAEHVRQLESIDRDWMPFIRVFSYSQFDDPGHTYQKYHTTAFSLDTHIDSLIEIAQGHPKARLIIVAYSLGALVATIALRRLARERGRTLRRQVPLIVLIAPPLFGAPDVVEFLKTEELEFQESPMILFDIASAKGELLVEAREAIGELLGAGLAVTIIHSLDDHFAPHTPLLDPRLFEISPTDERLSNPTSNKYLNHLRMRTLNENHRLIYYLTKPSVSLQPPSGA